MKTLKEEILVDAVVYNRVPETKSKVHSTLIEKLIEKGIKEEDISIRTVEMPKVGCCKQIKVIAEGKKVKKKIANKNKK